MRQRRRIVLIACVLSLLATANAAVAHGGEKHESASAIEQVGPRNWNELWRAWAWEPGSVACLAILAAMYGVGLWRLWRAAGVGHGVKRWEAACFAGGWLTLVVALVSPLHPWGSVLFSAHMSQHELLMLIAAPCLVLGQPVVPCLHALPRSWAHAVGRFTNLSLWRRGWQVISNPFTAWMIHAVVLWGWHAPVLFQATQGSE